MRLRFNIEGRKEGKCSIEGPCNWPTLVQIGRQDECSTALPPLLQVPATELASDLAPPSASKLAKVPPSCQATRTAAGCEAGCHHEQEAAPDGAGRLAVLKPVSGQRVVIGAAGAGDLPALAGILVWELFTDPLGHHTSGEQEARPYAGMDWSKFKVCHSSTRAGRRGLPGHK